MANEQKWECGYCGDVWKESLVLYGLYRTDPVRCLKCGETQLLKKLKQGATGTNPFGYPDAPTKKPELSYEFED